MVGAIAAAVLIVGAGITALVLAIRGGGSAADAGALDVAREAQQSSDAIAEAESEEDATLDVSPAAPPPVLEAGALDAGRDAARDAGRDGGRDGGRDAGKDAGKKDAGKHKPAPGHH